MQFRPNGDIYVSVTSVRTNHALGRPTWQSSTLKPSGLAVDGLTSTSSETHEEQFPYWVVDLQNPIWVTSVALTNRGSESKPCYTETNIYCQFDEILLIDCSRSCQNNNFLCSHAVTEIRQHEEFSFQCAHSTCRHTKIKQIRFQFFEFFMHIDSNRYILVIKNAGCTWEQIGTWLIVYIHFS